MATEIHSRPPPSSSIWNYLFYHFGFPTIIDCWRHFITSRSEGQSTSVLLTIHRSIKALYSCIVWILCLQSYSKRSSELERALQIARKNKRISPLSYRDEPEDEEQTEESSTEESRTIRETSTLGSRDEITSDLAVWRVDWIINHSSRLKDMNVDLSNTNQDVEDLCCAIIAIKQIDISLSPILTECLQRSHRAARAVEVIDERSQVSYEPEFHQERLQELWDLLKPGEQLDSYHTKMWQQLGFQGMDPGTDFRGAGLLGLDALIVFGRYYGKTAQALVAEAVDGGPSWYPWALASINITWWCISLAKKKQLQLFLLSAEAGTQELMKDLPDELERFLLVQVRLTYLFHQYWRALEPSPNVMEFEFKFKVFKQIIIFGLMKGLIGGLGIGWIETKHPGSVSIPKI